MPLQVTQPLGLCPEDILFEHRRMNLRSRALQIAHHSIGGTEHGVDLRREQLVDALLFHHLAHPAVEQDVTRQCDDKRTNSQYYRRNVHSNEALPSGAR